ncbi:MAG: 5'/3'-nucleotidase SurE [Opitutales bacterium]|nr:5'/3'-nucleotidase SurE [Opitutales bacterium]
MTRPIALVTNDDSIVSPLLTPLVEMASTICDVYVVVPASEQSWIGRAFSRHHGIEVKRIDKFNVPTWTISGTPSDCANIGIHNLLPQKPDIVLSGINIGYNATSTFIYSSGTVAGALEGAFHSIPSIAFSKSLPEASYHSITESHRIEDSDVIAGIEIDRGYIPRLIESAMEAGPCFGRVWNVNFPEFTHQDSPFRYTQPAAVKPFSFFKVDADGHASFHFSTRDKEDLPEDSDIACIRRGAISVSALDFSHLSPAHPTDSSDPLNLHLLS